MAERKSPFRDISQARLSTPDQLNQKLTVISPIGWAALTALSILIIAVVVWGFLGSISEKVSGAGVMLYSEGITPIISHTNGQITDISVRDNDRVLQGQVIARVSQDELVRQIEQVKRNILALENVTVNTLDIDVGFMNSEIYPEFVHLAGQIRLARAQLWAQELEALRNEQLLEDEREMQAMNVEMLEAQIRVMGSQIGEYQRLLSYQREVNIANAAAQDRERAASLNQPDQFLLNLQWQRNAAIDAGDDYEADILKKQINQYKAQVARHRSILGTIPSAAEQIINSPEFDPNVAQMQLQLENLKQQLRQAKLKEEQLDTTLTEYLWGGVFQTEEQIITLTEQFYDTKLIKLQDMRRDLDDLQFKLMIDSVITADSTGTIVGLNIRRHNYVQQGSVLGNIISLDRTGVSGIVLYVPVEQGRRISVGMDVHISPTTVNREEYGYILGIVTSVSAYTISHERMMNTLQDQPLVRMLAGDSAVIEVEVELLRNPETVSGYRWSTPKGAPITIDVGTLCKGEIKVADKRPVEMVMPFIKRLFYGSG